MADQQTPELEQIPTVDELAPGASDPGGAHAKGYSASPRPEPDVRDQGPIPLAQGGDQHVEKREEDQGLPPTGRSAPRDYTPNDRLMGADR